MYQKTKKNPNEMILQNFEKNKTKQNKKSLEKILQKIKILISKL